MTASEAALWRAISGGRLGVVFRRQVVVGEFIADFAAPALQVILEVDGGYHGRRTAADERRDRKLQQLGWRVVRISAESIVSNLAEVVEVVRGALPHHPAESADLPPSPTAFRSSNADK